MINKLAYSLISAVPASFGGMLGNGYQVRERWAIYLLFGLTSLFSTRTKMIAWKILIDMGILQEEF